MFTWIVWSVELGRLDRCRIQTADSMPDFHSLHSCGALFHTFSDASAARRRSGTGRRYSVRDLTIQVTSYMISPDLLIISRKRSNFSEIQRITLEAILGRPVYCVGKVGGQMRKLFSPFIHSAGRICLHLSSLIIDASLFFKWSKHVSSTTFPLECAVLSVMLSGCARLNCIDCKFLINQDAERNLAFRFGKVVGLNFPLWHLNSTLAAVPTTCRKW